jgi:hypothetical protein
MCKAKGLTCIALCRVVCTTAHGKAKCTAKFGRTAALGVAAEI